MRLKDQKKKKKEKEKEKEKERMIEIKEDIFLIKRRQQQQKKKKIKDILSDYNLSLLLHHRKLHIGFFK